MKKYLLSFLLLAFVSAGTSIGNAQNLPSGDEKTFEIMVSPFAANPISFDQFRVRLFQNSETAYRMRGNIGYDSNRLGENRRDSQFMIELAPGIEWHVFQHSRLSMYYGGELSLLYNTTRNQINLDRTDKNTNNSGYFGFGVNAIAGLDVHFLQRLYTGIEIGYGVEMLNFLNAEIDGNTVENNRRDTSLGSFYYPRFRLGLKF